MHASETAISKANAAAGRKELAEMAVEKARQEAVKAANLIENAAKKKLGLPGFCRHPQLTGPKLTRGHMRKTGTKLVAVLTKELGSGNFTGEQKPKKRKDRAELAIQQNLACEKHMEDAKSVIEEVAKKIKIIDAAKGPNEDANNTKELLQQAEDATDTMAKIAIGQHVVAIKSQIAPLLPMDAIASDALAPLLPIQAPPDLKEGGGEEPAQEDVLDDVPVEEVHIETAAEEVESAAEEVESAAEEVESAVHIESVDEDVLISRGAGTVGDLPFTPLAKMRKMLPKPSILMDPVHGRIEQYSNGQMLDPLSGEVVYVDNRPDSALLPGEKRDETHEFSDEGDEEEELDDFDKDLRAMNDDSEDDDDGDDESFGQTLRAHDDDPRATRWSEGMMTQVLRYGAMKGRSVREMMIATVASENVYLEKGSTKFHFERVAEKITSLGLEKERVLVRTKGQNKPKLFRFPVLKVTKLQDEVSTAATRFINTHKDETFDTDDLSNMDRELNIIVQQKREMLQGKRAKKDKAVKQRAAALIHACVQNQHTAHASTAPAAPTEPPATTEAPTLTDQNIIAPTQTTLPSDNSFSTSKPYKNTRMSSPSMDKSTPTGTGLTQSTSFTKGLGGMMTNMGHSDLLRAQTMKHAVDRKLLLEEQRLIQDAATQDKTASMEESRLNLEARKLDLEERKFALLERREIAEMEERKKAMEERKRKSDLMDQRIHELNEREHAFRAREFQGQQWTDNASAPHPCNAPAAAPTVAQQHVPEQQQHQQQQAHLFEVFKRQQATIAQAQQAHQAQAQQAQQQAQAQQAQQQSLQALQQGSQQQKFGNNWGM